MSKAFRVCVMTFLILAATAVLLFGQTDQGGVRGTVSDPTGAVVPGATITATNIATGVTTSTVSTSAGLYSIPTLRAGVYRVQAEHMGFKKAVRDNVTVNAAVILGLDLTLEVGQMTQIVEVQASAALVEKETTTLDTSVNPRTYLDLPLNVGGSRSAEAFISLAPGVYGNGSFNYNANGGQLFSREVRIDGLDVSNILSQPGDTSKVMTLPPEALQEFTYQTSTPSADQGNNMSGTIQYTIRSGTNQLHGSVYEFYTGNALAARNFFQSNLSRNAQNEYGGTIGGPIYIPHLYNGKNRSFFFFNSNNFVTRSSPNNQFITVPTAQEHFGDFSDYKNAQGQLIPIYDPATTAPAAGGGFTRTPFPGNIIPADRISAISANIATGIPNPPPGSGLAANLLTRNLNTNGFHNQTIKIDHILNDRQRFSFTFNRNNSSQLQCGNPCFDPTNTKPVTVAAGVESSQLFTAKHRFYHLNYDLTISPMTLFHTTVGVDWYAQINNWDSYAKDWGQFLGLSNVGNGPFPGIQFGSGSFGSLRAQYVGLGVQGNGNNDLYAGWVPQGVWSFTLIRGRNSFKFGGEHQWFQNEITQPNNTAEYIFTPNETALPTALATTGNPFASFLLGEVDSGSRHVQNEATTAVYWYHGLYVQDDIKVSKNLAVNAGLRYELFAPFYDKHDVMSIMSPTTPNPGCGGCPGALIFAGNGPGRTGTRRLSPPIVKNNFTPRLGIAYSLKPTVVIRSGYAILDEMPAAAGSGGVRWSDLGFVADQVFQSSNNGVTPAFNWTNPFPAFRQPPFIDPSFGIGSVVDIYDSNASHPAYLQEWHFNVQDSFRPNWLLDVGYVGSKGTRLYSGTNNVNQTNSKYLSLGPLLTDSITDPAVVAAGFKPPYAGFQGSLAQALRPFPQYLYVGAGINELDLLLLGGAQNGSSTYHALQAKLQHNFTQGLFLLASYTWSKWLTNAPTTAGAGTGSISTQGGFEGVSARDQYNRKLEHALGPTPPQAFTLAFNYELPVGPGKRFAGSATGLASKVLKGWQLNGILSYYAGTPLTVFVNNTLPIFNDINFPNIVSGVPQKLTTHITTPKGPGAQLYLNPAAFAQPAPFTYGNGPQTLDVRGFGMPNENIGLMKRTYFAGEKANLEIRFEVFNVFNRHTFGGIDSNLNDPNFGQVTSVSAGRTAQIGGKIVF